MMAPFVVDNTMLSAMAQCETLAWVRHVKQLDKRDRSEDAPLIAGLAIHEAVAWRFAGNSVLTAMDAFHIKYKGWYEANYNSEDSRWQKDGRKTGKWYRFRYHNVEKCILEWLKRPFPTTRHHCP